MKTCPFCNSSTPENAIRCPTCDKELSLILYQGEHGVITTTELQLTTPDYFFRSQFRCHITDIAAIEVTNNFWRGKNYSYQSVIDCILGIIFFGLFIASQSRIITRIDFVYLPIGIFSLSKGIIGLWNLTRTDVYFVIANIKPSAKKSRRIITICDEFEPTQAQAIADRIRTHITP